MPTNLFMDKGEFHNWTRWSGNCYEAAARVVASDILGEGATLVHGAPLGTGGKVEGIRYGHAWVEKGETVFDVTTPAGASGIPRIIYYAIGQIRSTVRYTREQAIAKMIEKEHYGPWDPEQDQICEDAKRAVRARKHKPTKRKRRRISL